MSVEIIAFVFGCLLIFVGVVGGGIEIKEIRVPKIANTTRVLATSIGLVFIVIGVFFRYDLSGGNKDTEKVQGKQEIVTEEEVNHLKLQQEQEEKLRIEKEQRLVEQRLQQDKKGNKDRSRAEKKVQSQKNERVADNNRKLKRQQEQEENLRIKEEELLAEQRLQQDKKENKDGSRAEKEVQPQKNERVADNNKRTYTAQCVVSDKSLLITSDGIVLSPEMGYTDIGRRIPSVNPDCAFGMLSNTGKKYCVEHTGFVYLIDNKNSVHVGKCEPCVGGQCYQ
jgi:hypothetical protein